MSCLPKLASAAVLNLCGAVTAGARRVASAIAAPFVWCHARIRAVELWIWAHRMAVLGILASFALFYLVKIGRCDAVGAFLVIAGPLFGWISERGHRREAAEREAVDENRVKEIAAIRGGGMGGWGGGDWQEPAWMEKGQKKLEDLFGGDKDAKK